MKTDENKYIDGLVLNVISNSIKAELQSLIQKFEDVLHEKT